MPCRASRWDLHNHQERAEKLQRVLNSGRDGSLHMIITIDIDKEAPGIYMARAKIGSTEVSEVQTYGRIEDAIKGEAIRSTGFADFLEFTYGGMSTGTYVTEGVAAKAADLADRLIELIAEMHRIEESRL